MTTGPGTGRLGAAATVQRLRAALEAWPDVETIYGPAMQKPGQYFMRFVMADGNSFAIEFSREADE